MQLQVFYLHSCARTSAGWLKDSHIQSGVVSTLRLLATAAQFVTLENDPVLPPVDNVAEPHVQWAMRSAYNYQWCLSYYDTLFEISRDVFKLKLNNHRIRTQLYKHIRSFPTEQFSPPPCLFPREYLQATTEESYRNYYKQVEAKPSTYNKNVTPFWVRTSQRVILHRTPEQRYAKDLSENPLADLED